MGTATVPEILRQTWMLFYDHRCAEELHLIFLLFDQIKRHHANKSASYRIKSAGEREKKFIDVVNSDDFKENLETAVADPKSKECKMLKKTISPLVKIVGKNVPWSVFERRNTLGKIYALTHLFGLATHFITLSPNMRHNTIALRMCVTQTNDAEKKFEMPTILARSQMIVKNPVAATHAFYRLLEKFFEIIVKLPITTFNGKNMDFEELIKQESCKEYGAYGRITAHYGVMEEQKGGSLHYHGLLFGGWDVRILQQWIHLGKASQMFQQMVDSHISCRIPQRFKDEKPEINYAEPYPDACNVELEAAKFAAVLNHHKHTPTCWKGPRRDCRLAMPQPQAAKTFFTEICADENGQPKRKYPQTESGEEKISDPPVRGHNAFSIKDIRVIVSRLARVDEFEEMQVEINFLTTALLRCNTSTQILITESQAKTAAYYIARYISKHPYQLENICALILQAEEEYRKYGSKAEDAKAPSRKAKNMLSKIINKTALLEVSDQQAAAAAMGYPSFISSHNFAFMEPWKAVVRHCELHENVAENYDDDEDDLDDQVDKDDEDVDPEQNLFATLQLDRKTDRAYSISSLERYLHRGPDLQMYCLYVYTLTIGHRKPLKNKSTDPQKSGRPDNPNWKYEPNSKPAKDFEQIMNSKPMVPRMCGKHPPAYPGDPPSKDASQSKRKVWTKKAKTFVQFYSLLLLPFDKNLNLIPPYDSILPWNEETSWNNFWKTFNEFENAKNFYHRAIWFIFHNMVDNMRQNDKERSLVFKWRFIKADNAAEKESDILPNGQHGNEFVENENDFSMILNEIQAKYGHNPHASASENAKTKAIAFVNRQIETYLELQKHDKRQDANPKQFANYTAKECQKIIRTMLDSDSTVENKNGTSAVNNANSNENDPMEFNKQKVKELHDYQKKVVDQLKKIKKNNIGTVDTKPGQLLAFIQGNPGSGKTFTAKRLSEKLGSHALFAGTTGTAAAELKAETINKILRLGLNTCDFKQSNLSLSKKQYIIDKLDNVDMLVIDEVSMLTPVTLAKINMYIQDALGSDYLFGGLDVLLIGDMFQFPPVQRGLRKPALYQAAVMLALGLNLPNDAYRIGAETFTKFQMVILDGQSRATKEFNQWLAQLRDLTVEYPITPEWLSQLTTLTAQDFATTEDWSETNLVVSGNAERHKFISEKMKIFGIKHKQPILRWICPLRVARNEWQTLQVDPEYVNKELVKYFVAGAKCHLTESLETKLGLGKGTPGMLIGVAWKNKQDEQQLDKLPIGKITDVKQPDYIVIEIDKRKIAIKPKATSFEDTKNERRRYLAHEFELSAAVTFHKMQGKTVDKTILSLNSTNKISKRIFPISISSLYVGCSRVHEHDELRILPLSLEDKKYLMTLKWDPYLRLFFQNFDENGKWQPNGLKKQRVEFVTKVKLELGLTELSELTVPELKKFADKLDVIVASKKSTPNKANYMKSLKKAHAEGQKMLNKDNGHLLKVYRLKLLKELQKKQIEKLDLSELRYYCRRLQKMNCNTTNKSQLQCLINKLLMQKDIIVHEHQNVEQQMIDNVINQCNSKSSMDIDDDSEDEYENVDKFDIKEIAYENEYWCCSRCSFINAPSTKDCMVCDSLDLNSNTNDIKQDTDLLYAVDEIVCPYCKHSVSDNDFDTHLKTCNGKQYQQQLSQLMNVDGESEANTNNNNDTEKQVDLVYNFDEILCPCCEQAMSENVFDVHLNNCTTEYYQQQHCNSMDVGEIIHDTKQLNLNAEKVDVIIVADEYEMQQIQERNKEDAQKQQKIYNVMQMNQSEMIWKDNESGNDDFDSDEDDDIIKSYYQK